MILKKNKIEDTQNNEHKEIWFDAREITDENGVISAVFNTSFKCILIKPDQLKDIQTQIPSRMDLAIFKNDANQTIAGVNVVVSESKEDLLSINDKRIKKALYKVIKDKNTLHIAVKEGSEFDYLIVKLSDETNIPLELLIAELQSTNTKLFKEVSTVEDAKIAFGVLETGADGILLSTNDVKEIYAMEKEMKNRLKGKINIVEATVEEIRYVGMGERSCIDCCSLMGLDEGMIIGSTSQGGILVCSEVHPLPYMDTRPFRVNAGSVHSYVWAPDGKTKYITELKAGENVLCVNVDGTTRIVTVGRSKIETRPLILIKAKVEDTPINVIMQDDWHVRVFGADGKPRNVTTLKPGDKILAHVCEAGRHVGIKVDETILEV